MDQYKFYLYNGPVMEFDRCITDDWKGSTYAASEKRARSNLAYQFKKQNNRAAATRISLPGTLSCIPYERSGR